MLVLVGSLLLPTWLEAQAPSTVVIRVGDEAVTLEAVESRVREAAAEGGGVAVTDSLVTSVVDGLVDKLVLSLEARANVRGDTTGLAAQLRALRRDRLLELYRADVTRDVHVSEEDADRVFAWLGEELSVRHILTRTEEAARAILLELERGRDFEALVTTHSLDPWTVSVGGLLPWFTYGEVDALDEAAFPLSAGEIAGPIESSRGWHVIRLEARRPRERTPKDFGGEKFAEALRSRRREAALERNWDDVWAAVAARWVTEGVEAARTTHLRHVQRADSLTRALAARERAGEDISAERDAGLAPVIPDAVANTPIVACDGFSYTMSNAADAFAVTSGARRPRRFDIDYYRSWIEPYARDYILFRHAVRSGFDERDSVAAELDRATDLFFVQRLYQHEIVEGIEPTDEVVRSYFAAHENEFFWRPDIDLSVFRVGDVAVAREIRARLLGGAAFSLVRDAFALRDTSLEATQTGFKRSFPRTPALNALARSLDDRQGAVSDVITSGGKAMVVRIEGVGERVPMTFADAYDMAQRNCTVAMREKKLRGMLDSLRVVYGVEIDEAALRRIEATEGGT